MNTTLLALTLAATTLASGSALAQTGGPAAGGPGATATNAGPFETQPWGPHGRIENPRYTVERVTYPSGGTEVVGNLFTPAIPGRKPAVVIIGPVAFVKEQSPVQYASRLVREGYATLVFDPRHHGESGGKPRRHESGAAKVEDLRASIDFLVAREDVDSDRIFILAICQGVNWGIEAATLDARVKALAIVAGHYLTPDVTRMYVGDTAEARIRRSGEAEARFKATGEVSYIPVVSAQPTPPDPTALLTAPPIHQFYIRWADRGPFWNFHGLWENRIAAMSEGAIWSHDVRAVIAGLATPTLMVHADRAASGPQIPRDLFEMIPAARKKLVWLGSQNQLQFYEDPITIDQVVPHVARFFSGGADRAERQ
ncbi:dienelactone hydrolase [Bradyrhizobium sp. S3.3.6]